MKIPHLICCFSILVFSSIQLTLAQNDSVMANIEGNFQLEKMTLDNTFNWVFTTENFEYSNYNDDDTLQIYSFAQIYFEGNKAYIVGTETTSSYYIYPDSAVILYDFGLNISDTAYFEQNDLNSPVTVESINYESIGGKMRKKLTLSNQDTWMQGMGSILHPLWPVMSHFEVNYLVCQVDLQYLNSIDYYSLYYANNYCSGYNSVNTIYPVPPEKNVIKTVDLIGRETELKPNTLLVNIFDDGSMEKVFIVE